MTEKRAYTEAVKTGKYQKETGLLGKYDNVRRFWEDEVTRIFMRPYLNNLVDQKRKRLERLRILDLGCGSGDGHDLLMGVTSKDPGIYEYIVDVITPEILSLYMGVDVNQNLLNQARDIYHNNNKMNFIQGDFSKGLPLDKDEPAFDIYFTSFGTLSHNTDEQTIQLLADIARHIHKYGLIICDWLGRYSYEWQDLWDSNPQEETFMEYRISYIYPPEERDKVEIQSFPLRILTRDEALRMVQEASREAGIEITVSRFFDRSIFVGRHMDTAEYNRNCPKMRRAVNSLFESNLRTDLETVIIDYVPRIGFGHLNNFFEGFSMCWNALVNYTVEILSHYDMERRSITYAPEIFPYYPDPLKQTMQNIYKVIEGVGWLHGGDTRADIIEPQLGYALRKLEMDMQSGLGYGHGLVGIFEVIK